MRGRGYGAAVVTVTLLLFCAPLTAQITIKEGFESYARDALDKNAGGPNAAPNGAGNPWFGPLPPNAEVITEEDLVLPHSGNQMIRGAFVSGTDFDQNWYNIQYRLNCGEPLRGNLEFDWWFYDPDGSGGVDFRDYAALAFYDLAPADRDYPGAGSLNGSTQIQRLSLGATTATGTGFDGTKYQARIVGALDGYVSSGWFNLPVTRFVGWHHARISVGPPLGDGTNLVRFYIDDPVTPALVHNSMLAYGYNVLEINTKFGTHTGFFDDLTFTASDDDDGDGVLDACDQCPGTPVGISVDAFGCTWIPGDFNNDGFVNATDFQIFTECSSSQPHSSAVPYDPMDLPVSCLLAPDFQGFIAPDLDRDYVIGMNDFGILQRCYSGTLPGDPQCAD